MESKTSKDVCVDSTLPPTFEEACNGGSYASGDNVHVNHCPDGKQTITTKGCSHEGASPEKSKLADVPFIATSIATTYDKDVPPPYPENATQKIVSNTQATQAGKSHSKSPRSANRCNSHSNVIFWRLMLILTSSIGLYWFCKCFTIIATNDAYARTLKTVSDRIINDVVDVDVFDDPSEYEGELVHIVGRLWIDDTLEYEECNVAWKSVKLARTYDMSRVYNSLGPETHYMSKEWPQARISKDYICAPPTPESFLDLSNDQMVAASVRIGNFILGESLKNGFNDDLVVVSMVQEISQGQAVAVMYSAAGIGFESYSILGRVLDGQIEPAMPINDFDLSVPRRGLVSATQMIGDRYIFYKNQLNAENLWAIAVILVSVLAFFIVLGRYQSVVRAAMKNDLNQVMPKV